jgi:hypothetical protein
VENLIASLLEGGIDKYTWGIVVANKYFFGSFAFVAWQIIKYRVSQSETTKDDELVKRLEARFPFLKSGQ